ncbi:MAG: glucose-6-phosphate dehydrogenase [Candidatus Woesearchaeota archaeon]
MIMKDCISSQILTDQIRQGKTIVFSISLMIQAMKMTTKTLFVQFGGTGDLARKKLYPAFSELAAKGFDFEILALGRRYKTAEEFFKGVKISSSLKQRFDYLRFDLEESDSADLEDKIKEHAGKDTMIIFYLAVLPEYYEKVLPIIEHLDSTVSSAYNFRIVLEKPFGYDKESAKMFDDKIKSRFAEDDIFRVDHYLGKEFIQNLLVMRFTNEIISGIWRREYIDHVQIILDENNGIEQRTAYYNKVGVVRDMVQNHILQLVTHVMMYEPEDFVHEHISEAKLDVLRSINGIDDFILGRYETCPGSDDGCAPTFVALKLHTSQGAFEGVPIYIRTGKRQSSSRSLIYIQFKNFMTKTEKREEIPPNSMTIEIQPEMNINFTMNVKKPNESWNAHPVKFNFNHAETFRMNTPEAYEQILEKVLLDDRTLFPSSEEILESWRIVEPMLSLNIDPESYPDGSMPEGAKELIEKDGRRWMF